MAKEICISTTPHETRLAILEDDHLAEIYYERENEYTLAGSIYKGRVTRVLPGMQSSFVDVGLERDAFLYVTDFLEEQEDPEEYVSENNGAAREAQPRAGSGERAEAGERGESSRGGNSLELGSQDRLSLGRLGQDRKGERGRDGRAAAAGRRSGGQAPERAREQGLEGDGARRDRAREQAPLREAMAAAAPTVGNLQEKGDDEAPAGTRRWRGRHRRRRGARMGAPAEAGQLLNGATSDSQAALEEGRTAEESLAAPFSITEHGAPDGIAALHAPSSGAQAPFGSTPAPGGGMDEQPAAARAGRGRDRDARRAREPYAQASTLSRPGREQPRGPEAEVRATGSAIVLPGESISKYGGSAPAAAPASGRSSASRAVNYVPAQPSTVVELSGQWDGGAVLPGETLARYREGQPASETLSLAASSAENNSEPSAAEAWAGKWTGEAAASSQPGPSDSGSQAGSHADEVGGAGSFPSVRLGEGEASGSVELPAQAEPAEPDEPTGLREGTALAEQAPEHAGLPVPLAEPEMVAAAVSSASEDSAALEARVEEPGGAAHREPSPADAPEAPEYEPENASASYRVAPAGASELRLASPEREDAGEEAEAGAPAPLAPEFSAPLAPEVQPQPWSGSGWEPAEQAHPENSSLWSTPLEQHSEDRAPLPESAALASQPADLASEPAAMSLSIEERETNSQAPSALVYPEVYPEVYAEPAGKFAEPREGESDSIAYAARQIASEAQQVDLEAGERPPLPQFSDLVDQLQGFAPGSGLLEEETIEEEEYDFEPFDAQMEEGDQEDLEEETLAHHLDEQQIDQSTLSDAVRDSHLEQRVHPLVEASLLIEQEDAPFGLEEVEGETEFDEEDEEGAETEQAPGEPQRSGRREEARGGRSGRSSGRNGRRNGGRGRSAQTQDLPIISELLKQGQEILVQIAKEPIAKKGARITSHIALPGRFLVFMPTVHHIGVSRKIASDEERQRLKRILVSERGESSGGFIVRTAAEGASEEDLRADLRFLISLWTEIKQRSESAKAPALIYHDLNLIERILRDQVSSNFSTIWVDSEAEYERIIRFLNRFQPALVRRVKLYTKETPLFEHFGIQEEISKALKSKVWLKSGGSIVINQTEALVAIDINTGKYVGKTARLEDTIVKTNLDAIPEIVRQIRLRDLGGIIVIDFIDMDERKNRNKVLAALEEELKNDRAPSKVLQFNDFGLVAITRKRVKQSLERTLSVQCETCTGTGMVKSPITVCNEIYTEMRKMAKHLDGKDAMLRVHPEVVKQLKANNSRWINELEELAGKTIIIKSDPALHPEQFDIH